MRKIINYFKNKINGKPNIQKLVRNGLVLGKNVHIGPFVTLDDSHCWLIHIDDDVTIAPKATILAHDSSTKEHLGYTKIGKVYIGKKSFIGAGTIILPNVSIGENSIIGAGSVVTHNIPANSLAVGNPAIVIENTDSYIAKNKIKLSATDTIIYDHNYTLVGGITNKQKEKMKEELKEKEGYII